MTAYDVVVIGGGPAGLAAAITAKKQGAAVLLIEREARLGGILKQCIHDGFGLIRFQQKLSGPEYVERFAEEFEQLGIVCNTLTFVTAMEKRNDLFYMTVVNQEGVTDYVAKAVVFATGCRERTAKQVLIHGTRPSGVFTAGTAQHLVNLLGQMPAHKCILLGSGDIGLIMARRLTLEGAKVLGVYEVKSTPSGLTRNLVQCLEDYQIPLYLSHTVTRIFGDERLTAVEVAAVDERMRPIEGTKQIIACDTLILSVGLIPENELAETLHVPICQTTKGPICDETGMTVVEGVFSCGNALHVNDMVDYVTESGECAGRGAAAYAAAKPETAYVELHTDGALQYVVPQRLNRKGDLSQVCIYFRSKEVLKKGTLLICVDGKMLFQKTYQNLRPPEMERLEIDFEKFKIAEDAYVSIAIGKEELA